MKNISIKLKLLLLSSLSLIILSLALGIISYNKSKKTLIEIEFQKLQTERDSKVKQLENIFSLYSKQINLLKGTAYSTALADEYLEFYKDLEVSSHDSFPIENEVIQKSLPKWDKFYKKYTETYPFSDVYVISKEYGQVLYSYAKKADYGTNLLYGKYRKSNLAKLWHKVKDFKQTSFIDMETYSPNKNKPTMFIAAPIYIQSKFEAILAFEIDNSKIQDIMTFRSAYNELQEDYLVGEDYLMRSDSYLSPSTHSLFNSFNSKQNGQVKTKSAINAFKGLSNNEISIDYLNNEVLSSYIKFDIDEGLSWAVISEINLSEITKEISELKNYIIIITLITFFIVLSLMYFIIEKYIIFSLNKFQDGLLDFFKYLNGESTKIKFLENSSNDEIGIMSLAVNAGIKKTKINLEKTAYETWLKSSVHELNQKLIKINNLQTCCKTSISFLCTSINAGVGVFYLYNKEKKILNQQASYAHTNRDEATVSFKLEEGIVGQVAFQKEAILLTNIKKEQNLIRTGSLTQASYSTYTFALVYKDELYGVIELGSFLSFSQKEIDFLDLISKTICISLSTVIQNNTVQELLETSKRANEELYENQRELEITNKYMQQQQKMLEDANASMEEQQQQLEEANASMEEQQQQLVLSEQNLKLQNLQLEDSKKDIENKADELEKSGKYKSEFLANMSHELRTPLNSIILLSSLLEKNSKKTLNKDDIKKAKTIFDSGNELLRLINDILDLSKVESGKMNLLVDEFKSKDFLQEMKDVFDFTAKDKGLKFVILDELKDLIKSDKHKISQIIRNLISNAFKFTKEGSITLKIQKSPIHEFDFRISVIDTGMGIKKEKQDLIFKAFVQADGGTSREFGGTGLGLSISKELSKLLGGVLSLESKEDLGSEFIIDLPFLKKEQNNTIKEDFLSAKHIAPIVNMKNYGEITDDREIIKNNEEAYLIIDDDKTFTEVVYEEIKKVNSYGLIALDATSGLELVQNYNIKGIMLDLTLPDMDGIDVLTKLKANNKTRHIPIHIISSKDKNSDSLKLGAIGYLQKPVYDGDINKIIHSIDTFKKNQIKDLLIVEDNEVQREALIDLVGEGVNIKGVKTAKEAINIIKNEHFDTVVIDLGLEDGSGYEVCEFIKNSHANLPIIIYTEKDLQEDEKNKLQEYSNSIIIKTVTSNEKIINEINLFLHINQEKEQTPNINAEPIDLSNKKLLIVDDDIKNIFVLEAALEEFKAQIATCFNGEEAISYLKENPSTDLVLMDIMMPVMDGYEAIKQIRQMKELMHIPIIAVTAKAMKDDKDKCMQIGADDYLTKPIDLNILSSLIQKWSNKKHL